MATIRSIRGSALGPGTQCTVLAVLVALGAAQCLAFALWPPPDFPIPPQTLAVAAAVLAVLSAITLTILPRLSRGFVDLGVTLLVVTICGLAYLGDSAASQLAGAMGLCIMATYCAYFLPIGHLVFQVIVMAALFVAVTIASPHLGSPVYASIVVITLVAIAWIVSRIGSMLASVAVRDPLTGVLNRRGLEDVALLVHSVALRADRRVSVVAIDLNDFKGYNDRHGHAAGDQLLVDLARSWQRVLRAADILARTGGDEFVLVLTDTDAASAHALLARLHEVSGSPWAAGVAEWQRGASFADTMREADRALYLSKADRRTRR